MLLHIPNVLTKEQVKAFRTALDSTHWIDGNETSGSQSRLAKKNTQLPEGSELAQQLGGIILDAIGNNPLFVAAALPHKVYPPLFNRYGVGESFKLHIDNSIRKLRGTNFMIRTDLSSTLFFSEPEEYDGGELIIEDTYGTHSVKLPAGDMVLYPSTSLHQVTPLTRGERISSFFWTESMVRDDAQRTLLFDLDNSIQQVSQTLGHDSPSCIQLTGIYHNLLRRWAL